MITDIEIKAARHCINYALTQGADAVRVSLNKSCLDSCNLLNGQFDKVTHSTDRSLFLYIFAEGKYGTFSTNRFDIGELEGFITNAITMVKMLGEDPCRTLPNPTRVAKDALTGRELDLYDQTLEEGNSGKRLEKLQSMSIYDKVTPQGYRIISEECEYSESYDDSFLIDSQGFEGRHTESSYNCFTEITIQVEDGSRYSGYWWDAAVKDNTIQLEECSRKALERAAAQIDPKPRRSGRYRMIVDSSVASRLLSPVISALNGSSLQQKMSFLEDSLGKKIFPEDLTIMDLPRTQGKSGARLFDSEGVATKDMPIIENGVIKQYFINTYNAAKMGIEPTIEGVSVPYLKPFIKGQALSETEKEVSLKDILQLCGNGILVTGFNGGNSNPVTGDFSFGIEGFAFSKGKITHPVREMLITGNLMELWNNIIAAGSDMRPSVRWQIGSLAFENVSFAA